MTGFVVFGGVLLLLATVIVWAAIRAGGDAGKALGPGERRDAAIEALRELEFERGTGKLDEVEYRAIRRRLETEALEARDAAPGRSCPACGHAIGGGDRYCPSCGAAAASSGG